MPLLRYDIGDVVRVAESRDCACGLRSDGPLLERVEGRLSDCTEVNGETITPLMLDDAIHAALGPARRSSNGSSTATCCRSSIPGRATVRRAAARAVGTLLARSLRGEHVSAIAPEASGNIGW